MSNLITCRKDEEKQLDELLFVMTLAIFGATSNLAVGVKIGEVVVATLGCQWHNTQDSPGSLGSWNSLPKYTTPTPATTSSTTVIFPHHYSSYYSGPSWDCFFACQVLQCEDSSHMSKSRVHNIGKLGNPAALRLPALE